MTNISDYIATHAGQPLTPGDNILDFRDNPHTYEGIVAIPISGKEGKIRTNRGTYYASVFNIHIHPKTTTEPIEPNDIIRITTPRSTFYNRIGTVVNRGETCLRVVFTTDPEDVPYLAAFQFHISELMLERKVSR